MFESVRSTTGAVVAVGMFLATTLSAQAAGSDAFNRKALGTGWIVTAPTISISADQLVGSNLGLAYLKTGAKSNAASAVVYLNGTDLEYGAVAIGDVAGGSNAFVKIQQQNGGGTFDHAAFYTGNNVGSEFFALDTPVPSPATIDVAFNHTKAYLRITSSAGVQIYSYNYGTTFGDGGGLGTYGAVSLDNFVTYAGNALTLFSSDEERSIHVISGPSRERDLTK